MSQIASKVVTETTETVSGTHAVIAPVIVTTETRTQPGWQTTEFWQSLLATGAGLFLIVYGVLKSNDAAIQWGGVLSGVAAGGYAISRGIAKK